jgi:hypothetical protein
LAEAAYRAVSAASHSTTNAPDFARHDNDDEVRLLDQAEDQRSCSTSRRSITELALREAARMAGQSSDVEDDDDECTYASFTALSDELIESCKKRRKMVISQQDGGQLHLNLPTLEESAYSLASLSNESMFSKGGTDRISSNASKNDPSNGGGAESFSSNVPSKGSQTSIREDPYQSSEDTCRDATDRIVVFEMELWDPSSLGEDPPSRMGDTCSDYSPTKGGSPAEKRKRERDT